MRILITRPRHDKATNYLYFWSEPVIDIVQKKNVTLTDLSADKANKTLLWQYCKKVKPSIIFFNGHGSADTINGHENQPLVTTLDNLSIFTNCIFYCRSCDSASVLGQVLIDSGAAGFIGYRRKFTVGYMPQFLTHPLSDPLAKLFLEPSNLIPISLIKRNSMQEAYRKSQTAMHTNLRKMLSSDASSKQRYYAQYLWANIRNQVILGDKDAKVA